MTLLHELRRRGGRYGLATLCVGVGQGQAALFERASVATRQPRRGVAKRSSTTTAVSATLADVAMRTHRGGGLAGHAIRPSDRLPSDESTRWHLPPLAGRSAEPQERRAFASDVVTGRIDDCAEGRAGRASSTLTASRRSHRDKCRVSRHAVAEIPTATPARRVAKIVTAALGREASTIATCAIPRLDGDGIGVT